MILSTYSREGKFMKKSSLFLIKLMLVFLLSLLAGCSANKQSKTKVNLWKVNGSDDYKIIVRHTESVWHSQDITIIKDGDELTHSARCTPAPTEGQTCEVTAYDPGDYTVAGLFRTADSFLSGETAEWTDVEYNPEFGYPESIKYDHPEIIDEDQAWIVVSFEIID